MLTGLMTLGYGLGFSDYAWRVGLANGVLGLQMLMVVGTQIGSVLITRKDITSLFG